MSKLKIYRWLKPISKDIELSRSKGKTYYIFECICGKHISKRYDTVTDKSSCGCMLGKNRKGELYGKLTVLRELSRPKARDRLWECMCICGNLTEVWQANLLTGNTTSCGCKRKEPKERPPVIEVNSGDVVGQSKIIKELDPKIYTNGYKERKVLLMCSCGEEYMRSLYKLGSSTKCPRCLGTNLVGKTFGEWKVQSLAEPKIFSGGRVERVWSVKCSCGQTRDVMQSSLVSGNSTSCGHIKESKGVRYISKWLEDNCVTYKKEYTFPDCKNIHLLPFDFAVFNGDELVMLIEFDGQQHYDPIGYWDGDRKLERTKHNDSIKNDYCALKDLRLLRIPHWELKNINNILETSLRKLLL